MSDKEKEPVQDLEPKEDAKGGLAGDYLFEVKPKPGEDGGPVSEGGPGGDSKFWEDSLGA